LLCSLPLAGVSAGQDGVGPVPIHGVTGTLALQPNVDQFYAGVNTLLVGAQHLFRVTTGTEMHGTVDSLETLQPGTPVVVHYGPNGLKQADGVVTRVDLYKSRMTVRYPDGAAETFRLTHAEEAGRANTGKRVVVYYPDESGEKVAHFFKRTTP
jgi:hypothetical protein